MTTESTTDTNRRCPDRLVRKFRRGQRVSVDFQDGDTDENWTGIGKFVRYVKTNEPGLDYLTEHHAIVKTEPSDWGSVFPVRCISFPNKTETIQHANEP